MTRPRLESGMTSAALKSTATSANHTSVRVRIDWVLIKDCCQWLMSCALHGTECLFTMFVNLFSFQLRIQDMGAVTS